jgi:gliding motility-associated-like protein
MKKWLFINVLAGVLFVSSNVQAQLCQGSLGDPLVNITFGTGANPGAPLPAATTSYVFASSDCPNDGFYTVRNSTTACYGNSWHTLGADHTGNGNGYFMLVNSSFQPSAFYVDTVDLFCSNTTYEFAAWVMNVSRPNGGCNGNPIQPNLTFRIERLDGSVIQSYSTGNIPPLPAAQWKQYGFFFSTPNVSKVVLRLINNAPGGCGNDLALDDITFRPCGPTMNATSNGSSSIQNICEGQQTAINLSSDVSAFTNPYVQWQQSTNSGTTWTDIPGANSAAFTYNFLPGATAGNYLFRVSAAEVINMAIPRCRVASSALTVKVNANPVTSTTSNSPACEGSTMTITATGGTTYNWTGPNNFTQTGATLSIPNVTIDKAGRYRVEVTSTGNCKRFDSSDVIVRPRPDVTVSDDTVTVCLGQTAQLIASGAPTYLWTPSMGLSSSSIANPTATATFSTKYVVTGTDQSGCTDTANVYVTVLGKPLVDAGENKAIAEGNSVQLNGSVTSSSNYIWSPAYNVSDVASLKPTVTPAVDTFYVLTATSAQGCGVVADTVHIKVYKKIIIPNAFSPNGDGINDSWVIPALQAYPGSKVEVFNRYGQVVLQATSFKQWGGLYNNKPLPVGVYYYVIRLNGLPSLSGSITIVR